MKELALLYCLLACCLPALSQERYRTSAGEIHFNASTPLEDIDASNQMVNAILTDTGDFASVLLVKDFQFRRKLMQEHFNENFMESTTYPKAQYRGRIEDFSLAGLDNEPKKLPLRGKLTLHGVTRDLDTSVSLSKRGETVLLAAEFIIKPEEYDIEVPRFLFNKIAEEVEVDVTLELSGESPPEN